MCVKRIKCTLILKLIFSAWKIYDKTISDLKHVEAELVGLFSRLKAPCLFTMRISPQSTSGIDIFYWLDFFIFVNGLHTGTSKPYLLRWNKIHIGINNFHYPWSKSLIIITFELGYHHHHCHRQHCKRWRRKPWSRQIPSDAFPGRLSTV